MHTYRLGEGPEVRASLSQTNTKNWNLKMESVVCNLCGTAESRLLYRVPDLLLNRPQVEADLVQCQRCGLIYQSPRPTLAEIGQHYPPDYEPYADHETQTRGNWLLRKAIHYGSWKRCRFVTRHKRSGRLLDIGCAAGNFLRAMAGQPGDWDLHGVELVDEIAEFARRQYGLQVKTGTLEQAAYPDAHFDVVTMWDVLEHVHDPAATLREIWRILKPDGLLVVRVPNVDSWDARLFGRFWAGFDPPRHLYVFGKETLERTLGQNGFGILSHSSGIGSYVTFVLSVRFWMRGRGVRPETEERIAALLYHPLMRLLSVPVFYLSSITQRGPLLVTSARRLAQQP